MSGAGGGGRAGSAGANAPDVGQVSFLDQALWKQLNEAASQEGFVRAWLALQCRMVVGVERGVAVLGDPDSGAFAPAAYWPEEDTGTPELAAAAELALGEGRGVIHGGEENDSGFSTETYYAAYPFIVEGQIHGVVAIELHGSVKGQLRTIMRQLQWGASWIEVMLRRERTKDDKALIDQTAAALDLVGAALEEVRFAASVQAVVTELANRLDCDQVSIGFRRRGHTRVTAMSHSAQFGRRMNLIRDIGSAMDEAIDQRSLVLYPPISEGEYRITHAHAELARSHDAGTVLTVPLVAHERPLGAISFERPAGATFDRDTIGLCDCVAAVLGPLLESKRRDDRWVIWKLLESLWTQVGRLLGPRYLGRKLAALGIIAVVAFFYIARDDFRVTSPGAVEGLIQRVIVSPFDGYISSEHARPGETVREGMVLATLDDKDLALERLRWSTTRRQRITEYNRALASRGRAETNITKAQIEQADAQIALLDEQISRTKLKAPFDGFVVSGDLSQSIGAAVQRGQELFAIAPLASYRVILKVDESEISNVMVGQEGTLLVSSLPQNPLAYTIERITPVSEVKEGSNFFRVEARLIEATPRLRPGMEGIGKTTVDRRRLIWIWTHALIDWVRLQLWKWWP